MEAAVVQALPDDVEEGQLFLRSLPKGIGGNLWKARLTIIIPEQRFNLRTGCSLLSLHTSTSSLHTRE
jgi:hypothetical protein